MKRMIRTVLAATIFTFAFASPVLALLNPITPTASAACENRFLGIPPWYRGMTENPNASGTDCKIAGPDENDPDGLSKFIWKIVLNIIEMALVVIIYIASFFVLYGGFLYMTGGANPSMIEKGRKTILNAIIGLVIGLGSVAIVNLIFNGLFGSAGTTSSNGVKGIVNMSGEDLLANALNLAYFIAAIIAVIVIIISGIMYITSSGDPGRVTKAKNLITYAIVGLILVLVAFIITGFVAGRFTS